MSRALGEAVIEIGALAEIPEDLVRVVFELLYCIRLSLVEWFV